MKKADTVHADAMSSDIFDAALKASNLSNKTVAFLFGISESVVRRMRSKDARERVSYSQLFLLPPSFHLARLRLEADLFGLRRDAMRRAMDAFADLAMLDGGL